MKIKVIYILLLLLFGVYLYFANDIMLFMDSDSKIENIDFSDLKSNSEVYFCFGENEYLGGILEKVYFNGWAYCETEKDNYDKKINIIFKSIDCDNCYIVRSKAQIRADVYEAFRGEKNVYNNMNGLECQFSAIKIKDGVYDIYIQVVENDYNYGICNSGLKCKKEKDKLLLVLE